MMKPSDIPDDLSRLEHFIAEHEASYNLKPGTAARVIWHGDKKYQQTDLALVYLHGFKASHPEGDPTHRKVAKALGANLYLSRLQEHGIQSENPLQELTEQKLIQSAETAWAIGQKIGKKVILMGTSTGGSLALYLAAQAAFQDAIAALILYSPLIRFYGFNDKLLKYSFMRKLWGFIPGKSYQLQTTNTTKAEDRIWNSAYALQGVLALGDFIDRYMHKNLFAKVTCPVFSGYYYKNEQNQDKVVSVDAIQDMSTKLGSDSSFINLTNFPNAQSHIICSSLTSKAVPAVISQTVHFLKHIGLHKDNRKTLT